MDIDRTYCLLLCWLKQRLWFLDAYQVIKTFPLFFKQWSFRPYKYLQLSSSSVHVCESKGKRLKSMLHAAVTVTLRNYSTVTRSMHAAPVPANFNCYPGKNKKGQVCVCSYVCMSAAAFSHLRLYRTWPSGKTRSIMFSVVVSWMKDLLEWTKNTSGTQIFFTRRPSKVMLLLVELGNTNLSSFQ